MRVISGAAKGRKLLSPTGNAIRPTSDRVKEAVFNIIQFDIEGRSVLDLFAGTGQMGIEALSRGASRAVFVDESRAAQSLIRDNIARSGVENSKLIAADSIRYLESPERFGLIFIDPPYGTPLLNKAIEKIVKFDKLSVGGIIVCEYNEGYCFNEPESPYMLMRTYKYGDTRITICGRDV